MKYYMTETGETAWTTQDIIETFDEGTILFEMKRDIGGEMWCDIEEDFVGNDGCFRGCDDYNPCNGKNGRCRSLKNGFIETGRKFVLIDGKIALKGECVIPEIEIKKEIPGVEG